MQSEALERCCGFAGLLNSLHSYISLVLGSLTLRLRPSKSRLKSSLEVAIKSCS